MTQTDRDRSLVEHLAKVMGWERSRGEGRYTIERWRAKDGAWFPLSWSPLDSWADAGMVIDKVDNVGFGKAGGTYVASVVEAVASRSGPRAICEAVAKATGYVEAPDAHS